MDNAHRFVVLLVLSFAVLLAPCQSAAEPAPVGDTPRRFAYFKYIPGVTQEEIDAVERIRDTRSRLKLEVEFSASAFLTPDNRVGGFYALLGERMGELFGLPFETAIFDRTQLNARISAGKTDFTCGIPSSFGLDAPQFTVNTGIDKAVFAYRNPTLGASSVWNSKGGKARLAFLRSATFVDHVFLPYTDFIHVFVADYDEAIAGLNAGTIDAFFDFGTDAVAFEKYPNITGNEFLPLILSPVVVSTTNPDLAAFVTVMEKFILNGGQQEILALHERGRSEYNRSRLWANLNESERAFIEEHRGVPIPFAASHDNYPICFFDEKKQQYQGISIEVLGHISDLTGLTFVPSNKRGEVWRNLLEDLGHGRTAFVSELIYTNERGRFFLWPDRPYSVDSYALISLVEKDNIAIEQIPDFRIGVIPGTGYTNDFDRWFPNHPKRVEFSTYSKAFSALAAGSIDFVMGTKNLLLNNANYLEKTGFRANIIFDRQYESAYGFHPSQQILRDIFSKAQNLVDMEDITQRWTLRVYDYVGKMEQEKSRNNLRSMLSIGLAVIIAIVLIFAIFLRQKQITESLNKTLEETVRQRTAELEMQTISAEEASRAKSDFLARMSHEIRTPLNAIIGLSRIAKDSTTSGTKAHDATAGAISASLHLLGILNEVLDMTKIETGKLVLAVEPFMLKEAMEEVVSIIAEQCDEKQVSFEHNIDTLASLAVQGDKLHLKQVIINLLGNAAKFTPSGGKVGLRVDCASPRATGMVNIVFTVYDNGIGIPEDQLGRIYLAFEQANSSIATTFGGVGLGLSISQNLVSMMGGTISVESKVNCGTTFSFTLSLLLLETAPEENNGAPIIVDLSGKRILLAEDVEINRIILMECLSETKAVIDEAEDGVHACTMFEQSPHGYYDLILMDIQMPRMDGCAATVTIRALDRPDAKTVPIVAVTANAYQDDVDRALKAGMNRHLPKPVDFAQLMTTLRDIFP